MPNLVAALDIGGTFTDLVVFDNVTGELRHSKVPTTPSDLVAGIANSLKKAQLEMKSCGSFVHGSTVAINVVIEKKGAKTALVTTKGFRDAYLIDRGNRPQAYDIFFKRPEPLLPRGMIFEADERILVTGDVMKPLSDEEAQRVADRVAATDAEAVAVCFLHSYINRSHEAKMGKVLAKTTPSAYISLSHEILMEYREYERTSTTVVNSYIGPRVKRYLSELEELLNSQGFLGQLLIMTSSGGVMSVQSAVRRPVAVIESGPVGGVIASSDVGRKLGHRNLIAFDMGGTTAKASLIKDNEPTIVEGYYVGGPTGGYVGGRPVMLPVVDVVEVGAGGGTIAWIDEVGALKVGPRSAGAEPGPVCYPQGGTEPTITDANVVLGRINPARFLGGEMPLNIQKAKAAIEEQIASKLGLSTMEAAFGIVRIAVATMSNAIRGVSVEKGYDPRDFALVTFGGGGPLHATDVARELTIPRVIVPLLPAHFSAVGMLLADLRHDYVRTYYKLLTNSDFSEIKQAKEEMASEGRTTLLSEGAELQKIRVQTYFDLRYKGQEFYISTPVPDDKISSNAKEWIRSEFDALHDRLYGHEAPQEPVELVNIRVVAHAAREKFDISVSREITPRKAARVYRDAYLESPNEITRCEIYERETLPSGFVVNGPAIIEEYASTTVLHEGDSATVSDSGELVITIGGE